MSGKRNFVFELVINNHDFETEDVFESDAQKIADNLHCNLLCKKLQEHTLKMYLNFSHDKYLLKWSLIKHTLLIDKDSSYAHPESDVGLTTYSYFGGKFLMLLNQPKKYIGPTTSMHVKLEICVYRSVFYDLSQFSPHYADFLIKLDSGEQIYVSKSVLSNHSSFFNTYFNSTEYREYAQDEYKLHDVSFWPFIALLYVLYGIEITFRSLSDDHLKATVELAHRFQCDFAMRSFENHLLSLPVNKMKQWFDLAERYQMMELLRKIISSMTKEELKAIIPNNQVLGKLNPDTVQEVIGRLLDF
uniref:BTB domain-containing protein n=1 Tax=Steinernema glaseri TaxID=37863 RepID=A0A1I7Y585_9BILA